MEILYTDIPSYSFPPAGRTVAEGFKEALKHAEQADLFAGYISAASLYELDRLIHEPDCNLKKINLILGMYLYEGMQLSVFEAVRTVNDKWQREGIGQILIPSKMKDHEKVYLFYGPGNTTAIIGSANLSFLNPDLNAVPQREVSVMISDQNSADELNARKQLSENVKEIKDHADPFENVNLRIIYDSNPVIDNSEESQTVEMTDREKFRKYDFECLWKIPLKVPTEEQKQTGLATGEKIPYGKSNINVCYSSPRKNKNGKETAREWYEMQLNVESKYLSQPEYPDPDSPFFIVTDDGYQFKARTQSQRAKQLSACKSQKLMGEWLKGRLVALGLVKEVEEPYFNDPNYDSMITKEILDQYGAEHVLLGKTTLQEEDEDGNLLDVWYLSFNPDEVSQVQE